MEKRKKVIWMGIFSFWLFFVMEIVTDIVFGHKFPGYNWKTESISYLGQSGSPMQQWVLLWGIFFTILFTLFTYSFYQIYQSKKWIKLAVLLLIIYAFGEGLGSGCFPIDPEDTMITINGRLHNIFSGFGDIGLVLFPFVLMLLFPKKQNKKFHAFLWSVILLGLLMSSFFLIAKYFHPDNFISNLKGVWQRIYLFNYYLMLLVINFNMAKQMRLK